jgi:hypothetical protein
MLRVRAEPRPHRIRPRRGFGRSFAAVAAAACILGALVFGTSRVDTGGSSSTSGGGTTSAKAEERAADGVLSRAPQEPSPAVLPRSASGLRGRGQRQVILVGLPPALRAAVDGRTHLAAPLRQTFGALDPYHLRNRR